MQRTWTSFPVPCSDSLNRKCFLTQSQHNRSTAGIRTYTQSRSHDRMDWLGYNFATGKTPSTRYQLSTRYYDYLTNKIIQRVSIGYKTIHQPGTHKINTHHPSQQSPFRHRWLKRPGGGLKCGTLVFNWGLSINLTDKTADTKQWERIGNNAGKEE